MRDKDTTALRAVGKVEASAAGAAPVELEQPSTADEQRESDVSHVALLHAQLRMIRARGKAESAFWRELADDGLNALDLELIAELLDNVMLRHDAGAMRDLARIVRHHKNRSGRERRDWASICQQAFDAARGVDAQHLAALAERLLKHLRTIRPEAWDLSVECVRDELRTYATKGYTPEGLAAALACECRAFEYGHELTADERHILNAPGHPLEKAEIRKRQARAQSNAQRAFEKALSDG